MVNDFFVVLFECNDCLNKFEDGRSTDSMSLKSEAIVAGETPLAKTGEVVVVEGAGGSCNNAVVLAGGDIVVIDELFVVRDDDPQVMIIAGEEAAVLCNLFDLFCSHGLSLGFPVAPRLAFFLVFRMGPLTL